MRKRLFITGLFSSIVVLLCVIAVIPVAGTPPLQLDPTNQQGTINAVVNERFTATAIVQNANAATLEASTSASATPIPTFTLMPTATFDASFANFGVALTNNSIVIDVSQEAYEFYIEGWEQYWREDFRDAEDAFDEAIDLEPEWADAYFARSISHFARNEYADSLEDIQIAVELLGDADASMLSWRIYLNIEFNDIDAAIRDGEILMAETPYDVVALYNLAYAYFVDRQYEAAIETIDLALHYSPFDALNFDLRGDAHDELGLNDERRFDAAMANGVEEAEDGDFDAALESFEDALDRASETEKSDFNTALAYWNIALISYIDGETRDATDALDAAQEAYPALGAIYYLRAIFEQGSVRDSVYLENLNMGIENAPDFPNIYVSRGLYYEDNNDEALALADHWQYLQLKRSHSLLWQSIDPLDDELLLPFFDGWEHRFIVDAEAGDRLSINASESGIGTSYVDPIVVIIDPNGNPIASNDDEDGFSLNAEISRFELPIDGQYIIIIGVGTAGTSGIVELDVELD